MPPKRRKGSNPIKIEYEEDQVERKIGDQVISDPKNIRKKIKKEENRFPDVKRDLKSEPVEDVKWEPLNWHRVFTNIREMRKNLDTPVDDMGCESCADEAADPKVFRFHHLVALMLSSQTKDQVTHAAMQRLRAEKLSIDMILETPEVTIQTLIYPASFYKRKAIYLKQVAQILREKYDGDIPDSVEGLCALPGVGPKMAHLCMQCAWNTNSGIGVDTHVHRIANRLGWLKKESKMPEETRKGLEDWLPKDLWREVNWLLVGFGQTICTPLRPKCADCLNKSLCPYGAKAPIVVSSPRKKNSSRTGVKLEVP
ncbi:unnamed protein product [Notodromas monacha]|uniref:Endonuclease III homolog n=1 Tax=Notodromas monacha TaxID=399045 RepID=A0A7R9BGL9_9CRUS|nr:unnamed protein product [Notodromas monacha]CAG0915090.1 unnamed protein product [Notodromas monacha]